MLILYLLEVSIFDVCLFYVIENIITQTLCAACRFIMLSVRECVFVEMRACE
jgi:hypothetical protein